MQTKTPQLSLTGGAAGGRVSIVMGGGVTIDSVGKGVPGGEEAGGSVPGGVEAGGSVPGKGGGDSGTPGVGNGVIGAGVSGRMTPGVGARVVFLPASTRLIAANATMRIDFIVDGLNRIERGRGRYSIQGNWLSTIDAEDGPE